MYRRRKSRRRRPLQCELFETCDVLGLDAEILGRAYEKNNQAAKAIESYVESTNRDLQNPTAFLRLGILYGRRHNLPEANGVFDKAEVIYQSLGSVEGRAQVAYERGVLLNDIAGKVAEARLQLEQAREMAKVVNSQYQQIKILFQLSSVSFKEGKADQAQQYAGEAVELAQANQMESLIARGSIDLGNVYLVRGDYAEAERYFQQVLTFAQRFGGRQNEARARLSLASLYLQRGEAERALSHEEQARGFYQNGGYLTETLQSLLLRGRAYQQKGDYAAALQSSEQHLQLAQQTGDQSQLAYSHANLGQILLDSERYLEALQHFDESYARNKSLGNQLYLGYDLMNRGTAFWRLGRETDARVALGEASTIAKRPDSNFKELQAYINLHEAQISLNKRRFPDVVAKSRQALDLAGAQNKIVAVRGKYLIGLSQALSGQGSAGQAACQEARSASAPLGDPLLVATTQLALAEASLASGDMQSAIANARQSQTFFASTRLAESEWRAWLIAGLASQKAGDQENAPRYLSRAAEQLSSLEQKLGAEVFNNYLERPDIRLYRSQLGNNGFAAKS